MKGYEWLLEEPDLNVLITDELFKRFETFLEFEQNETLLETMARIAVWRDHSKLLRLAIDRGFNVQSDFGRALAKRVCWRCERVFLDAGLGFNIFNFSITTGTFFESRNRARSYAILVMYAMYKMDKTYKNVSAIIGRAIWESRGDTKNWLNCERPLKK